MNNKLTKEEFLQKLKTDKEFNDEFGNKGIDQISELIEQLKDNPDSRRLLVSAWSVHDLPKMTLPPCHYGFQVYTRKLTKEEKSEYAWNVLGWTVSNDLSELAFGEESGFPQRAISLMWNQRSVDTFLGLPFNIASYGLLLEIIAKEVNMVPDELIGNLGDTHLYLNHIEQAKEQIGEIIYEDSLTLYSPFHKDGIQKKIPIGSTREPYPLPKLKLDDWYSTQGDVNNSTEVIMDCLMGLNHGHITLENYQSHPTIKATLSN